jgi:hypothetical protein
MTAFTCDHSKVESALANATPANKNRKQPTDSERRLNRVADLAGNLRGMPIPRQWLTDTIKLLSEIHAGSYIAENRDRISASHRKWFTAKRATIQELRKPWRPQKKLAELPPYSQAEAWGRRLVAEMYYEALAEGLPPLWAERIACMFYLSIFGKAWCRKSVNRLIDTVERRGGIVLAPIEAFATERSVPHRAWPARRRTHRMRR